MSDQDSVLASVHDPEHVPSTDVVMPDSDYVGVPRDVVVSHNKTALTKGQKKSIPVKRLKLDGDSEEIKEQNATRKTKRSRNKNAGAKQQTMRMMFLESAEEKEDEDCNNSGEFRNGKCFCFPGFKGKSCDVALECPSMCLESSHHGICSRGKCFCKPGFEGEDCSITSKSVKKESSKKNGCPDDCSHNGICQANKCWCKDGFMGTSCAEAVDLASTAATTPNRGINSDMLSSVPLIPMNIMVVVGVAAFILGLVGATLRQRKQEREMALGSPDTKIPLFK